MGPAVSFGHVRAIVPEKLWYIRMENNALHFSLLSSVNFLIDMKLSGETMSAQKVDFTLKLINWLVGGKPIGLDKANI